ncbi:MAG TPA: rhamnulokinase [Chloroflexi bacterium]|jgi:rhamnulokinase|nr:rhamnulokinase [Chloroflexota bacterium]
MAQTIDYLAFDLGAESGRAIIGRFDGARLQLDTLHRFPNGPVTVGGRLYWDVLRLWAALKEGLARYRHEAGAALDGIGLDTWGVDFALLGADDALLANPRHYRDPRTEGMLEVAFARVPREEIFATTGIQFMPINTLYQLLAMRHGGDPTLDIARTLLMIPDLFTFWLTGVKACEFSNATTTQFYDPRRGAWATSLLERMDLPTAILPPVIQPGTIVGPLLPAVAEEVGLQATVIAPACHDTGSAVAAVPAAGDDFAYISSGTWSLMGVEAPAPVITPESLAFNLTNEGGVCGTFRLLKNIMGLWLVQECRRTWAAQGRTYSYADLTAMAAASPAFGPLVEPDCHDFLAPGDMPARVRAFCTRTGQTPPETEGAIVRCALESLALKYRWVLEKLEVLTGRTLRAIHVVGGGSQNGLLCQLTADATGRPVLAGPVEATAMGNALMQALARGRIGSLAEGREVVRRSCEVTTYAPRPAAAWDDAYARFLEIRAAVPEV